MGYLTNFIVYTLAMVGIIVLALFVFKYTTGTSKFNNKSGSKGLKVTDTLSLTPRKTLYVVETNGEKFLIAGDTDRTTLISKLETATIKLSDKNIKGAEYNENKNLGIHTVKKSPYDSAVKKISEEAGYKNKNSLSGQIW